MLLGRPQPLRRLLQLVAPARCTAENAALSPGASAPFQCRLPRDGGEQQHLMDLVLGHREVSGLSLSSVKAVSGGF